MQLERFTAPRRDRLDRLVAEQLEHLSRSQAQRLIEEGRVDVAGAPRTHAGREVAAGAEIGIRLPSQPDLDAMALELPLDVLFADEHTLIIAKQPGLLVHPVQGRPAVTLVHAVRARYPEVQEIGGSRSGLVHRLDRDTSGVIAFARSAAARDALRAQWKARETLKVYLALAEGVVEPRRGHIDAPLGPDPADPTRRAVVERGDPAFSDYHVLEQYGDEAALLEVRILTGRTHQIRVHLQATGHPILSDGLYGNPSPRIARQALHARRLGLCLPSSGEWREFEAPLPADIAEAIAALRRAHGVAPGPLTTAAAGTIGSTSAGTNGGAR